MSDPTVSPEALRFLSVVDWAITTEHDCYGEPPPDDGSTPRWCLYDASEDDPPVATSDSRFMVEALLEAVQFTLAAQASARGSNDA